MGQDLRDGLNVVAPLRAAPMLAALSHELRQPLAALELELDALSEGAGSNDGGRGIGRARVSAACARRLMCSTVELSRLETGDKTPRPMDVPLDDMLQSRALALADYAALVGAELMVSRTTARVRADPGLLELVVLNCMECAVKRGARAQILVEAHRTPALLRVEVCRDGALGDPALARLDPVLVLAASLAQHLALSLSFGSGARGPFVATIELPYAGDGLGPSQHR